MRQTVFALALSGFSLTACDNPPPIIDDVAEESESDAGSGSQDSGPGDAAQAE